MMLHYDQSCTLVIIIVASEAGLRLQDRNTVFSAFPGAPKGQLDLKLCGEL